jgi:hypothetical protein
MEYSKKAEKLACTGKKKSKAIPITGREGL